jgi:hypothetical protein
MIDKGPSHKFKNAWQTRAAARDMVRCGRAGVEAHEGTNAIMVASSSTQWMLADHRTASVVVLGPMPSSHRLQQQSRPLFERVLVQFERLSFARAVWDRFRNCKKFLRQRRRGQGRTRQISEVGVVSLPTEFLAKTVAKKRLRDGFRRELPASDGPSLGTPRYFCLDRLHQGETEFSLPLIACV